LEERRIQHGLPARVFIVAEVLSRVNLSTNTYRIYILVDSKHRLVPFAITDYKQQMETEIEVIDTYSLTLLITRRLATADRSRVTKNSPRDAVFYAFWTWWKLLCRLVWTHGCSICVTAVGKMRKCENEDE